MLSFVGVAAIAISIALLPAARCKDRTQYFMIILLLLAHLSVAMYYYRYTNHASADAWGYYYDPSNQYLRPFSVGTVPVFKLVHFLKVELQASYLDCFLLFQSIGLAGLVFLARVFKEIEEKLQVPDRRGYLGLLFLPTLLFWTAAIGKDAPLFFSISVLVWSILNLRQRFAYFCVAVGIMVLFRAHIALLAMTALAAAAFFERTGSLGRRLGLMMIAVVGIWLVIGPAQRTINFDETSVSSIATYVDEQQSIYATAGGSTAVVHAPLLVRIVSLLFRPFFFDAHGMLGLIPSIENIGAIIAFVYVIGRWREMAHLARRVFFVRFMLIFATALLFSLALVYYNVGLGLRERVMAYPMILSSLVALWSFRRKLAQAAPRSREDGVFSRSYAIRPAPES